LRFKFDPKEKIRILPGKAIAGSLARKKTGSYGICLDDGQNLSRGQGNLLHKRRNRNGKRGIL